MRQRLGAIQLLLLLLVAFSLAGASTAIFGVRLTGKETRADYYSPPWSCSGLAAWCYHYWCPNVDGRGGGDTECMEQCSNDHQSAQWKGQSCFTGWSDPPDTQNSWDCDELGFLCWRECGEDPSCSGTCVDRRDPGNSCGWSGGGDGDGGGYDSAGSDCMEIMKGGAVIGYEYCTWGGSDGSCTVYNTAGNTICVQNADDWSGTSSMQNCFYPGATVNGASPGGTVWCESDYYNCHLGDSGGQAISNEGLSLGAPSSCESWGDSGGGTGSVGCSMMSLDPAAMMGGSVSCPSFIDTSSSDGSAGTESDGDTSGTKSVPTEKRILNTTEKRALEVNRIKSLDYGDYAPCLYPPLEDLAWRMQDLTLYKEVHDAWNTKMKREHSITEEEYRELQACPEDVTPTGGGDEDCDAIERKCQLMASPILALEGEEGFATIVQECMNNKSANLSTTCVYSGTVEHARVREEVGATCETDSDCGARGFCNTWDYHEKPPKGHPLVAKIMEEGVFLGRCQKIPAEKCLRDADCGPESMCEQTRVCVAPPCFQQCSLTRASQETTQDCRLFTRENVRRKLMDEGTENVAPAEIEKMYVQWIHDQGMTVEEFEQCDVQQPTDPSGQKEQSHTAAPEEGAEASGDVRSQLSGDNGKLGRVFGDAVQMFLSLLTRAQEGGMAQDFVQLVQDGMRWFSSALLRIALQESNLAQEVVQARDWVTRIRSAMPEDLLAGMDSPKERGERRTMVFGNLRAMLREADDMLRAENGWISQFLTELSGVSYNGKDAEREKQWRSALENAQKRFYGTKEEQYTNGVVHVCGVFLADLHQAATGEAAFEEGSERLHRCGDRVEEIFLFLEEEIKEEVDRYVPGDVLQSIMEAIGESPIGPSEGGHDRNDGDSGDSDDHEEDACWRQVKKILGSERVKKLEQCAAKTGCGRDDHSERCEEVWPRCFEQTATGPEMRLLQEGDACNDDDGGDGHGGGVRGGKTAPPATYEEKFTIRSFVDGVSDVVISGPKLFYRHHEFQAPGLWKSHTESYEKGKGEPTFVNGESWQPKWGTAETYHCHGCTSDSYPSPVSVEGKDVRVEFSGARENAYVKEFPTEWNGWQLVITFDDWGSAGAAWYEATVYVIADAIGGGGGNDDNNGGGSHSIYTQNIVCEHDLYSRLSSSTAPATTLGKAYCGKAGCYYKDSGNLDKGYCDSRGCTPDAEAFTQKLNFGPCLGDMTGGDGDRPGGPGGADGGECRYDLAYSMNNDGITYSKQNKLGKVLKRRNDSVGAQMDSSGMWVEIYVDDSGREYQNNKEVYVDYDSCDCNGDNVFDDCDSQPGPGTQMSCNHDQVSIGGATVSESIMCDNHGDCVGGTTGLFYAMSGNVDMGRCDCDADGEFDDCGYGGGQGTQPGGGSTSGMRNCWYENASRNGTPFVDTKIWCAGDYSDCHFDSPTGTVVTFDGLSLGAPTSCESWGDTGGGDGGASACVYRGYTVNSDATVGPELSEYVKYGNMGSSYIGVTTGTTYAQGTVEADYTSCDCNADGVLDDCGEAGGGGYEACVSYGITIRSTGQTIEEGVRCGGASFCTGVQSGKQYASSALEWTNTCNDCDGDGVCEGDNAYIPPPRGACMALSVNRADGDLQSYPAPVPGESTRTSGSDYAVIQVGQITLSDLSSECPYQQGKLKEDYCGTGNTESFRFVNVAPDPNDPYRWGSMEFSDGGAEQTCSQPAAAFPGRDIVHSILRFLSLR